MLEAQDDICTIMTMESGKPFAESQGRVSFRVGTLLICNGNIMSFLHMQHLLPLCAC